MNCKYCRKLIPVKRVRRHADYCSNECRKLFERSKWNEMNPGRITKSPSFIGTISELRVSSDLFLQGFHVFRALSPDAPCDLIATKGEIVLKVQVKTGSITAKGLVSWGNGKNEKANKHDVLAITLPSEIMYRPRLEDLA